MKKSVQLVVYCILAQIVWTASAFIGYIFFGPGNQPTLIGSVVASIVIILATFFLAKAYNHKAGLNPVVLGALAGTFTLIINLLITILNGTTQVFLNYYLYFTFLAISLGSWLGAKQAKIVNTN